MERRGRTGGVNGGCACSSSNGGGAGGGGGDRRWLRLRLWLWWRWRSISHGVDSDWVGDARHTGGGDSYNGGRDCGNDGIAASGGRDGDASRKRSRRHTGGGGGREKREILLSQKKKYRTRRGSNGTSAEKSVLARCLTRPFAHPFRWLPMLMPFWSGWLVRTTKKKGDH